MKVLRNPTQEIGDAEFSRMLGRYNLGSLIRGMVDNGNSEHGRLEMEVGQELARRSGTKPTGVIVPFEVFTRDLVVGTPTAGGHTVATNLLSKSFINMLRPVSVVANLGATPLTGLVGKVAIPRQTSAGTAYWVAENSAPTESQQAFDQVPMTAKTLGAYTNISRKMVLQSSIDIQGFVAADLRASLGQELDRVILAGSGTGNEPAGILNDSNIATTSLGTNGAALTWGNIVDLESSISLSNAEGITNAYITTKQARSKLSTTTKINAVASDFIWEKSDFQQLPGEGMLNGYRAIASTLMPSNITKGSGTNLSTMIYGNWSDIVIGNWGPGVEIMMDPYTFSNTGAIRIVALTDVDFVIRHPESFRKITDIVTT